MDNKWSLTYGHEMDLTPMMVLKKPNGETVCTYHRTIYQTWLLYMWGFPKQEFSSMVACVRDAERRSQHPLVVEDFHHG